MLKISSWFRNPIPDAKVDAIGVYRYVMNQARSKQLFSKFSIPDDFDGRMEALSLHLGILIDDLSRRDENAGKLSQAIYDVMVDDFDVALREEGLSDTGVSRRIKPMAKLVLSRAKQYGEALQNMNNEENVTEITKKFCGAGDETAARNLAKYAIEFSEILKSLNLGQIARASFDFPKI